LQLLILVKLFLNKKIFFLPSHFEIQVCTILVCALYLIKYGKPSLMRVRHLPSAPPRVNHSLTTLENER
jgi:hypothetical protein